MSGSLQPPADPPSGRRSARLPAASAEAAPDPLRAAPDPAPPGRLHQDHWSAALLALALGAAANAIAIGVPGSVPLLLGLVVPTRFANRGQPGWALLSGLLVGLATGEASLAGFCVLVAVLAVVLARRPLRQRLLLGPLLAIPAATIALTFAELLVPATLGVALLALSTLLAQSASHLLFDLPAAQEQPTLRSRLAASFTLALAPGLFIGLLLVTQWYWLAAALGQSEAAQRGAAQMVLYVEEHVGEHLRAVAQAADDASAVGRPPSLAGLHRRLQGFLTLLVTDADGALTDFHAPDAPPELPAPVADREYFQRPRDSGLPFVSGVFRGRGFGDDALVAVSAPYYRADGNFAGVVEGSLSLETLRGRLASMARGAGLGVVLRDAEGRVVATTLPGYTVTEAVHGRALQPGGARRGLPLNAARDQLLVDQSLPSLGWRLAALRPLAPIAADQTRSHLALTLLSLGGLWMVHWLSARFARSLSQPLDQLLGRFRAIDLDQPSSLQPLRLDAGYAELAELREDFNAMLQRLGELDRRLRASLQAQAGLNRDLERRVARRTEDLHEALNKARQLADAKSNFLANMSHELRTPLTSILGYAELAMAEDAGEPARVEALRTIHRQGEHLLAVVNDVLDAGRIESGSLRVEASEVALSGLLQDLQGIFAERARGHGVALRVEVDPGMPQGLIADPLRLRQVLINLLGNAIKFTSQGEVRLRVRRCLGALVLSVRDTGIGIDPAARARLFLPFSQADLSTTRRFGGSGLGLFISRRLSEAMGGRLMLHSRPGQGSRFAVVFPLALAVWDIRQPAPAPVADPAQRPRLRGRVMVAEDVEDLRRLVVAMVSATGAEVRECGNGREALELATAWTPDLVLMDMHMPVMDGPQATRALREGGLRVPIIALTADVLAEDRRRFLDAGCDDVLHKPIRRDTLHTLLTRHLPPAAGQVDAAGLPEVLASLRRRYAARLTEEADALDTLVGQGDLGGLLEKLHTLKGSAGTFGFADVSEAAAGLESLLRRGSSLTDGAAGSALDVLLDRLRSAPAGLPEPPSGTGPDGGNGSAAGNLGP